MPSETKTFLIQCTMLVAGVNTLIQAYRIGPIGARLPIVVGTSFAFVPVALSIGSKYGYEGILGAALVGAIFEIFIGAIIKKIRRYFPPVVTGVIVLSIGLSLLPVGVSNFAGGVGSADFGSFPNLFIGMVVLITVIFFKQFTKGITSTGSIFVGTVVGFIVAFFMGKVDLTPVRNAAIISFPTPFTYGITFHADACLAR